MSAKRARPLAKAAPDAVENRRLRKIERSSIGALLRDSMSTNAGSSTTARIRPGIVSDEVQPSSPPLEIP